MKTNSIRLEDISRARQNSIRRLYGSAGIFSSSALANFLLVLFIVTDSATLYSLWNLTITDNPVMVLLIAGAMALILDVPCSVAGVVTAQWKAGLRRKKEALLILVACVATFLIAFSLSLSFRLVTKEMAVDTDTGAGLSDTLSAAAETPQTGEEGSVTTTAALLLGFLPFLTSGCSFAVSLALCDPVTDRIRLLEKEDVGIRTQICLLRQALMQAQHFYEDGIRREQALYREYNAELDAMIAEVEQTARAIHMEHSPDADSLSVITESATASKNAAVRQMERAVALLPEDADPGTELEADPGATADEDPDTRAAAVLPAA